MTNAALRTVGKAASQRVRDVGPGRVQAFMAAAVTGVAAGVATYKLLRSNQSGG